MSLLALESFDNIASADLGAKGWVVAGTSPSVSSVQARTGSSSLELHGGSSVVRETARRAVGDVDTLIIGYALYLTDGSYLMIFSSGGGLDQISLTIAASGAVEVRRGGITGLVLATSATPLPFNAWHFLEVKVKVHDTAGTVDVRLNGASILSFSGDTANTAGVTTVQEVMLTGPSAASGIHYFDDLYIANALGTVNNNFLGDLRVRSLAPTGNGNSSQLLGSDGNSIDNYLLVDDPTPATADYVGSATLDQKDTYTFADLPDTSGTVLGVQVNAHATKTDTGARNLALVTRSGAVDYDSPDLALPFSSNAFVQHVRELDPATAAAWTRAAVNAAEFGAKVR